MDAIRVVARFPRKLETGTVFQTLGQVVGKNKPCIKLYTQPPPHGHLVETLPAGLVFGPIEAWEPHWLTYKGVTAMTISVQWTHRGMKVWSNICHGEIQYCIMRPDLFGSEVKGPGDLNIVQKLEIGGGTLELASPPPSGVSNNSTFQFSLRSLAGLPRHLFF